jgi:peptidyl-prolyl cis-trans isomerase A (cyclophilin A)
MHKRPLFGSAILAGVVLLAACSRSTEAPKTVEERKPVEAPPKPAPASDVPREFKVRFDTSKGPFVVEVHRDWAPIGVARFHELVKTGYFDGARFFRVVPNFVIQFGLAADPNVSKKWDKAIDDDPVMQTNKLGSLAFATAGPRTRTTQIFINMGSNQALDSQGFAPFAQVIEGLEVVRRIYPGYGQKPDQDAITKSGNAYLTKSFPNLDYIRSAKIL